MANLSLYNSLNRKKESFIPINDKHVRIYACGPTVYNYAHIGNARMAVVFDVLSTLLKQLYPKVTYASNITDVDDKIMARAQETGEKISDITQKYTSIYNGDMAYLGVKTPDIQPKATEHILDMVEMIQALIDTGHAYAEQGHVLFHVPSYPQYGALSGRSRDEQIAGARVEVAPYKKDAADFILWKPSSPDQPGWDSPWGFGRPGWHIECSAMSGKHLGFPFDIHGGGADLKFPHHENEIAQSCCAQHAISGNPAQADSFAKYWVHNGFLTVEGEKMSKSIGNVVLVHDLIEKGIEGEIIRMALLSAHYRQPLDWSQDTLKNCRAQIDRFYQALHNVPADNIPTHEDEDRSPAIRPDNPVFLALCDDLNTPKAFAALNELTQKVNTSKDPTLRQDLLAAGHLLGLLKNNPAQWLGYKLGKGQDDILTDSQGNQFSSGDIDNLLIERQQARADKNFARADEIRDQLADLNIQIEDTPQGPKWRRGS